MSLTRWGWALSWIILVFTVQPWTEDGSNAPKALALGIALGLALLFFTVDSQIRIPGAVWVLLLYAAIFIPVTLTLPESGSALVRWVRLLASLLIAILFGGRVFNRDASLGRWHLWAHVALGASVLTGLLASPGEAYQAPLGDAAEGPRLVGVLLPLTAPRVGEVGAIIVGLSFLMLAFGRLGRWSALALVGMGSFLIIESGTRTALGSLFAGVSLAFAANWRTSAGRRGLKVLFGLAVAGVFALPALLAFLVRGQDLKLLLTLTGRTLTWEYIASLPLTMKERLFGHGLGQFTLLMRRSDNTYDEMPIDNGFVSLYWTCGLVGVFLIAVFMVLLWWDVLRAPQSLNKALAVFLAGYVSVACITETGLGDLSSHTMHLLAALYLACAVRWKIQSGKTVNSGEFIRMKSGRLVNAQSSD